MSEFDVTPGEMKLLRGVDDADIERLLTGRIPAGGDAPELISFFNALGEAFPKQADPELESAHVAAMMRAAQSAPAEPVSAPVTTRQTVRARLVTLVNLRGRLAAGGLAACTAFSGMAVAGVLPPSIQRVVADAAGHVGIDLPGATVNEGLPATDWKPLDSSNDIAEPVGKDAVREGRSNAASDDGDPERRRGGGVAPSDGAKTAEGSGDREEDAAGDARDAEEEAAGDARDAEEEAAGDARDAEEEAAGDAQDAEEEAAGDAQDREEAAAQEAADADES